MAQCNICKQWDGKHLPSCRYYTGEIDNPGDPIDQEKEYCSICRELLPNHKTTCPLYDSGGGVITDDKSICVNCGKLTSVSIFNDFKCENCGKSAVEVEDEPPTTSEPIRGVGDKICTNKELYEFADDSSKPSNENRCPSKGKWNNKNLGRWNLSIDDHIKDNQLFALKNVVKELRPINLAMNFDITSSRDADNLIFNFEVMNTNTNPDLLTKYTKNGNIAIYGYYIDNNRWREFACTYQYSNETSNQFWFKETEITKSKQKSNFIQQPATGEYHNIDSWIKEIYLDGILVYNSNYPVSLYDPTTDNPINLTVKISGNTDTSRPELGGPKYNSIYMEIDSNKTGIGTLSNANVVFADGWTDKNITTNRFKLTNGGEVLRYTNDDGFWSWETVGIFDFEYIMKITNGIITIEKVKEDVTSVDGGTYYKQTGDLWDGRPTVSDYTIQSTRYTDIDLNYKIFEIPEPGEWTSSKFRWERDRYIDLLKEIQ